MPIARPALPSADSARSALAFLTGVAVRRSCNSGRGLGFASALPRRSVCCRLLAWQVKRGFHPWSPAASADAHPAPQVIPFCFLLSADNLAGTGVVACSVRRRSASRTLAGGDEAEFSAFVARDGGQLLGFAFLLVGNRHDAEDLVQQALLRTAGRWPAARQSPARYSRTVLLNLVRDRWRARQRRHAETLSPDLTALPSASDAAAAVLDRQLLLRACRRLPLQQRAVLVLRFWEDRSVEETAAVLGCTAGTVKSHTHRALARLREALADPAGAAPGESTTRKETAC